MAIAHSASSSVKIRNTTFDRIREIRSQTGVKVPEIVGAGIAALMMLPQSKRRALFEDLQRQSIAVDRRVKPLVPAGNVGP